MTAPNAELAYRVLDRIDAHPKQWDQGTWLYEKGNCGTVACFAGWASTLAGYEPELGHWMTFHNETTRSALAMTSPSGDRMDVREAARIELGISGEQADYLFAGGNTREDLGEYVAEIFGPRPAVTA